MTLRPYQNKAIEAVEAEFAKGIRSTLIVLATGCGKTIVFSNLAAREVRNGGRVLILAHRGELLEQAIDKLYKATGIRAGLEKADVTSDTDIDTPPFTVVVGSVQSMKSPKRLARFSRNEFSLIIIDECHHALTGTYRAVIDYFSNAKLLGVTATPDRGDLRDLSEVFQTISFEYSIVEAIRDGYLSSINAQTIPLKIDLRGVAKQAGDYQAAGLGAALIPYLHQICREIKQRCADRKTIVFTPLISISREMVEIFKAEGIENVREVNGESADRAETLEWFANAPKGCVLCNSMLLTEGYDEPSVDCIVILRATKVRALYVQMVGRGTRLCEGKKNLLLLDFLWLTSTHDLCRPAHLLSDNENICRMITKKQEKKAGTEEMEITPELIEETESEFTKKCKDTLAKKLEAQSRKKGKLFDALQFAELTGIVELKNVSNKLDESDRPTMEQFDQLEKLGFACPGSAKGAEELLTAYQDRVNSGLTTAKQIRFLSSRGFQNVNKWKQTDAEKLIRRIAACGWSRLPHGINPATYTP
jgi:superfamily II DNA or RNA helicase